MHIPRALSFELDSSGNWTWACCDADVAVSYFQTYSATEIDLPKRPDGSHRILISLCTLNSSVLYNRNGNDSKLRIAWSLPVLYIKWTCTVWICNYYTFNIRYLIKTGIYAHAQSVCKASPVVGGGWSQSHGYMSILSKKSFLHFKATIQVLVGWKPKIAFIFLVMFWIVLSSRVQVRTHQTFQFPFVRLSTVNPKLYTSTNKSETLHR